MKRSTLFRGAGLSGLAVFAAGNAMAQFGGAAPAHGLLGVDCDAKPAYHCPDEYCLGSYITQPGDTVEMKTRRPYFLDCPTGYKPGDKVNIVLSLHGAGSYANWQRNYFPAYDVKDKYHLVIITPGSPTRTWSAYDDDYLHNIVDSVVAAVGKANVDHFILDGHSQGGATSARLICTPYFKDKVDVRISLSGGRTSGPTLPGKPGENRGAVAVYLNDPDNPAPARGAGRGGAPGAAPARGGAAGARGAAPTATAGGFARAGAAAPGRGGAAGAPGRGGPPGGIGGASAPGEGANDCTYSFIYSAGEYENIPSPDSPMATKYGCGAREEKPDIIDPKKGYVFDSSRQDPGQDSWGHYPRSGRDLEYVYPNCKDGLLVADFSRLSKGHTEGYEPNLTDEVIRLALTAKGGKIAGGTWSPPAPPAAAGRGGFPGAGAPGGGRGGAAPGAAAPGRGGGRAG